VSSGSFSLEEILNQVSSIAECRYDEDAIKENLVALKREALEQDQQEVAAHIWCLQEAISVHSSYLAAFSMLKQRAFYDAWCELEKAEKGLWAIKPPQKYLPDYWEGIWIGGRYDFIEKHVSRWQGLFPYECFISPGMTYKEYCSVCNSEINPRKPCGHNDGEIYHGEMRMRVITDIRYNHIALVRNPANRFSVLFLVDPETGEQVDHYDYRLVEGLASVLTDPFQEWDYVIQQVERDYAYFKELGVGEQDPCPCGSEKKYGDCCINSAIPMPHFQFTMRRFHLRPFEIKVSTQ
jgi:hypothetical protein